MFEWDETKAIINRRVHGIEFAQVARFEFENALEIDDTLSEHGEIRIKAFSFIGNRVYALVYTPRGANIRVISLRKATKLEILEYVEYIER